MAPATKSSGEQLAGIGVIELCYETFGDDGEAPLLLIMGLATQMIWWEDEFLPAASRAWVLGGAL